MSHKDKNPYLHMKGKGANQPKPEDDMDIDENQESAEPLSLEHPDYAELEAKLNETEEQLNTANAIAEDYKRQALRAQADLENVRKRTEKDIANAHKYGLERLVTDLLPIIDSLERGLTLDVSHNEFAQRVHEGMEMTRNLFLDTLSKVGVKPVDPLNESFNPELHQAISMQENPEVPPNTVLQVLQKGYLLNDRLIRPALVVVSQPNP